MLEGRRITVVNELPGPDSKTGQGLLRGTLYVAAGGTAGTLSRYLLHGQIGSVAGLPAGIFVINISGAFLLGVLIGALARSGPDRGHQRDLRLLLGTGLLGGYTTYSLLATDAAQLLLDQRVAAGVGYGLGTVVAGGLASWVGIGVARVVRRSR